MTPNSLSAGKWVRIALVTVPVIVAIGFVAGRTAGSGFGNPWFDALVRPPAMPPGWVFGGVWTALYVMLGVALARVLASRPSPQRQYALAIFLLQLLLNYAWTPLFFGAHQVFASLILLLAIFVFAVVTTFAFAKLDRIAAWLTVPYLIWLSFASILNFQIFQLN